MSGAEHIHIASAQFPQINVPNEPRPDNQSTNHGNVENNVNVSSVYFATSSDEGETGYENSFLGEEAGEDGGSVVDWDVGRCFGEGLSGVQSMGEGLGMFDTNKVQSCGVAEMGTNISNCGSAQQVGDGVNPVGPGSLMSEGGKDGSAMSIGGNEKSWGECQVENNNQMSSCDNDTMKQNEESACVMLPTTQEHTLGYGTRTLESSALQNPMLQDYPESELLDAKVILPNSAVPQVKIGIELQNDTTVETNPVEDLSKDYKGSGNSSEMLATSSWVEPVSEPPDEGKCGSVLAEQSEHEEKAASGDTLGNPVEKQNTESEMNDIGLTPVDATPKTLVAEVGNSDLGNLGSSDWIKLASHPKSYPKQSGPVSEETDEKVYVMVLAIPADSVSETPKQGRRLEKASAVSTEKKYSLRSSVDSIRALDRKSVDNSEAPQPSSNLEGSSQRKRGRKKKSELKGKSHDEFARMTKHLKYLLHRIKYEQNLLDAYSSEGWRGQSIEKLRPEKELERAKADINSSKLKIRDLFQRLESMSAEGKFPDSLYDDAGLIDSEDIFCAKCGSKDLFTDNDIILCDGACDRGFHQFCLDPPLRTEEIPPGDEGWLCPACDCKVDCIELLNDSQGTKLKIQDSWEKVFPDAVAAMAGNELDDMMGLPSDDSEDNDYNPDGADDDVNEERESSSDESNSDDESDSDEASSVSEDLGAVRNNEQYLGLPSDDSEDDDYDPDAANINEDVEHESSSSDFSSASEDLGAAVDNDEALVIEATPLRSLEPNEGTGDCPPRRHVERLDYKQLYDETYGNATSDSSDDEEWTDIDAIKKRQGNAKKGAHGDVSASAGGTSTVSTPRRRGRKKLNPQADGTANMETSRRRGRKKLNVQAASDSPDEPTESSQKSYSGDKSSKKSMSRLGEAVTQRLYESFKENQYPDRQAKAQLAKELGLTPKKVDKWFGNARWSFNHHPARFQGSMAAVFSHSNTPLNAACSGAENATAASTAAPECANDSSKLEPKESGGRKSTPRNCRKRKNTVDGDQIIQSPNAGTSAEGTQTDTLQTPETQPRRGRRRKSGAQ